MTLFIVFTTAKCNLRCRYCGGSIESSVMPSDVTYDVRDLVRFIESDKNPSIAFYGGEPLLNVRFIKEVMDKAEVEHYILQTNGTLLRNLDKRYLKKFSTILISIDGRKEVTDFYKGAVYEKVVGNARWLSEFFDGELIARMVASRKTEIFTEVSHLLDLGIFTHVHWQIDAIWGELNKEEFEKWSENYKAGLSALVEKFAVGLKNGEIYGIVPFLGVLSALEYGNSLKPPCGSGSESYAVTTDGRVVACPVCADLDWNHVGTIHDDPGNLKKVFPVDPCPSCEIFEVCGSRCLFSNRERLWGEWGFKKLCELTNFLVKKMEDIRKVMKDEGLKVPKYPEFLNTTEIIP